MTKNDFLSELIDKKYIIACKKMLNGNSLYKDLYQDLYIEFFESKESRFKNIKCASCFIFKTLSNMVHSNTSRFYYKYKKKQDPKKIIENTDNSSYNYLIDLQAQKANKVLSVIPSHDRIIFSDWVDGKSKSRISKEKNISLYFIRE